ncbi:Phosphatidylinositol 4-kinase pik1alpha (PI4-kinase)(PtdIns-4-kinase) [Dimargaris cristalligena]|nr:Phosphatidylinositol 4-kinase pik1alpha (PI4-kinase)(PtdIns-4-kinase) [Dimargaris cristalligena]
MSSNSLLLRLFTSQFFSSWLAVSYLYKYPDSVGIQHYLCNALKKFPVEEIEFFLPQLCHFLLTRPNDSVALEALLLEQCEKSTHICLIMVWYLQSYLSDFSNLPASPSFRLCRRMLNQCQEIIFADDMTSSDGDSILSAESLSVVPSLANPVPARPPKPSRRRFRFWRFKVRENVPAAFVGIGSMMAGIGQPMLSANAGQVAVIQGRRSRLDSRAFETEPLTYVSDDSQSDKSGKPGLKGRSVTLEGSEPAKRLIGSVATTPVPPHPYASDHDRSHSEASLLPPSTTLPLSRSTSSTTPQTAAGATASERRFRPASPPHPPTLEDFHQGRAFSVKKFYDKALARSQNQSSSATTAAGRSSRFRSSTMEAMSFSDGEPSRDRRNVCQSIPPATSDLGPLATADGPNSHLGEHALSSSLDNAGRSPHAATFSEGADGFASATVGRAGRVPTFERDLLHRHYFQSELQFVMSLTDISNRLVFVSRPDRQSSLKAELLLLNHNLPANVCLPLWCPARDRYGTHHKVVRISPADAVVLNSAERAPYLIMVEAVNGDLSVEELSAIGKANMAKQRKERLAGSTAKRDSLASGTASSIEPKSDSATEESSMIHRSITADAVLNMDGALARSMSLLQLNSTNSPASTDMATTQSEHRMTAHRASMLESTAWDLTDTSLGSTDWTSSRRRTTSAGNLGSNPATPSALNTQEAALLDLPSVDLGDLSLSTPTTPPLAKSAGLVEGRVSDQLADNNTQHQQQVHLRRNSTVAEDFQERMRTAAVLLAQLAQQEGKKKSWYQRQSAPSALPSSSLTGLSHNTLVQGMAASAAGANNSLAAGTAGHDGSNNAAPRPAFTAQGTDQIRARIIQEMMALEEQRMRLMDPPHSAQRKSSLTITTIPDKGERKDKVNADATIPSLNTESTPTTPALAAPRTSESVVTVEGDILEDQKLLQDKVKHKDDPSAAVFREDWETKEARIRASSPYGSLPGWQLFSVIVKTGGDLRQEQFALQLIKEMQRIWKAEDLDIWCQYYRILVLSDSAGLVETIKNTISIHSLKKEAYSRRTTAELPVFTLYDYYLLEYGAPNTERFLKAQDNFMRSLVGYSLISYILQLKDRHNGNILVDKEGHLVHIDFGFMLMNSPGSMGFEMAPFKLSQEYLDVLGGVDSVKFAEFRDLMVKGFLVLRKYAENIILLVDMMQQESKFPCFASSGPHAVAALRDRFQMSLTEAQVNDFVDKMIISSCCSVYTRLYDTFQYYSNGIL